MKKIIIAVAIIIVLGLGTGLIYQKKNAQLAAEKDAQNQKMLANPEVKLPEFTVAQLAEFNGTDPNKPIYIGMDGLVYDVSAGRNFYETDAVYHYLAGRDSSEDLKIAGADIIKRKYPVIGTIIQE